MPEFTPPIKGILKGVSSDVISPEHSERMNNVRALDTLEARLRIGQRPGLDKWGNGDRIGADEQPVVAMCTVSSVV